MKNIVLIGGGSGTFTLLKGLRQFPSNNSVILPTWDDGGSTGILRKELGVMPPGDLRQCLVGLSYTTEELAALFNYRFENGALKGHSAGNIIIAALEKVTGNIDDAIAVAGRLLNVRGSVIPATTKATVLSATLVNGKKVKGEHLIDEPEGKKIPPIGKIFLSKAPVNQKAVRAIEDADAIIFGPGDLYTSILPSLLVPEIGKAMGKTKAKKILITNIMTRFGQTDNFKASDFLKVMDDYLKKTGGGKIDIALVNEKKPGSAMIQKYRSERASFVEPDRSKLGKIGTRVIFDTLISEEIHKKAASDVLKRSSLRHDAKKTASIVWNIIK